MRHPVVVVTQESSLSDICRESSDSFPSALLFYLHKWLDFRSLGELLFAHRLRHFAWVTVDSGDESVSVASILRAIVLLLDDDR